ncbi:MULTISPECIES: RepB family plasmid replication initiator protein [Enterococcus]|uniref:RepB family plasmid replication initiator protein n=4 Tax=Enterococcus faecalis TaxID=1351 RepID=A0AAX3AUL6_ENTFL|nr:MULTISPECIES: RepB family plasmid replication initiator protein [Enterococcus]MCV3143282.1 RepB family plasmid replication initiator protein [Enterococcus faecalis]MCV3160009.1 RepB family plasmid replication initiator protein [Enterococcus faecalis]MCV5984543.1 RepB family plasmid replication initiator protein [Enterococcus faecalis]MCV6015009.1 RepB family plasmid replication initiator protein [Enterococcus faecalis]MDK0489687.1 RepB family plasmid replication initiator protein [Enterococ
MSSIPEKQENQKQVLTLNELSKRKVVEHNSLITSIAKMDKTPLKMFELAVSYINTEEPPKDNIVYLSKRDLFAFFKVSDNDKHSRFKEAIEKMQKQAFFQIKEEAGKGFKFKSIVPIPYVEWTDYHDEVKIEFHREIMPYLINLKKNFTQHALSDLAELNSKYSIILYRWLSMNYNQYEHYSVKGVRRAEQVESYRNPSISIKELRIMTDTVNDYERFQSLETWILKKPLEEINAHTSFDVTYDKIKKGRSIDSIVFHIEKKRCADDNSYKLNDKMYQAEQAKKEEIEDRLAIEAMKNKYTKLLLDNMLLNSYEMTDTAIMAGLQQHVYPLYDELKDLHGMKAVQDHLSYVASKQEAYSKRNIAKYLKKAIEQYLPTVRGSVIENMADLLKKNRG